MIMEKEIDGHPYSSGTAVPYLDDGTRPADTIRVCRNLPRSSKIAVHASSVGKSIARTTSRTYRGGEWACGHANTITKLRHLALLSTRNLAESHEQGN